MNQTMSAAAQNRKIGKKTVRVNFEELKEMVDAGVKYFLSRRPSGCCPRLRHAGCRILMNHTPHHG